MTGAQATWARPWRGVDATPPDWRLLARRGAPTLLAGAFALVYVLVSPPSLDLAAHMFRAKLFGAEGLGIWNNRWYAGHHTPGYSLLFPPAAWLLTPQLAAALAATATAALFERLATDQLGEQAWLGALWFGAATATDLYTGRLAFAFGLLPALGATLALARGRPWLASLLAVITALSSPVAALFLGLVGAAYALGGLIGHRDRAALWSGTTVLLAALVPVGALAYAFPEGGSEPFIFAALWPVLVLGAGALLALPREAWTLRVGVLIYTLGCLVSYFVATPIGSNAVRLAALVGGPLAALLWWRRRTVLLALVVLPLLYLQWQPPIRDVKNATGDKSHSAAYYHPLEAFLGRQSGPPFRLEIPFTGFHWEAYEVASRFAIARGWERQLDIKDNPVFYSGPLTPARYETWLRTVAVRFVAVSDSPRLDYSARRETVLIDRGLTYLRPVFGSAHWRVYAVQRATPIVTGAATLTALGPDSLTLSTERPGTALVRVHFTPYWALSGAPGCVAPWGDYTKLTLRRRGPVRLVIRFSLARIAARSPRCS